MKFLLLVVISLTVWTWMTGALPLAHGKSSPMEHPRTTRDVFKTIADTFKNTTSYVGRALHIIKKRNLNETGTKFISHNKLREHLENENGTDISEDQWSQQNITSKANQSIPIIMKDKLRNEFFVSNNESNERKKGAEQKARNCSTNNHSELSSNEDIEKNGTKINSSCCNRSPKNESELTETKSIKKSSISKLLSGNYVTSRRKLLGKFIDFDDMKPHSVVDEVSNNDIEEVEINLGDKGKSTYSINEVRQDILPYITLKSTNTDLDMMKHLKCVCTVYLEESCDAAPIISEHLLDYPKEKKIDEYELVCSGVCTVKSRPYFHLQQIVFCSHMDVSTQNEGPNYNATSDGNLTDIHCKVILSEEEKSVQSLISWLNLVLIDVMICCSALACVGLYMTCVAGRKKKRLVTVYSGIAVSNTRRLMSQIKN